MKNSSKPKWEKPLLEILDIDKTRSGKMGGGNESMGAGSGVGS